MGNLGWLMLWALVAAMAVIVTLIFVSNSLNGGGAT